MHQFKLTLAPLAIFAVYTVRVNMRPLARGGSSQQVRGVIQ